jgi:hypothetical protein
MTLPWSESGVVIGETETLIPPPLRKSGCDMPHRLG